MVQITLDLELGFEVKPSELPVLQGPSELGVHRGIAQVGDMGDHPCEREPLHRTLLSIVVTTAPCGVGGYRLPSNLVERDLLRGRGACGRDRDRLPDHRWIGDHPLQHLHAAHRATGNSKELADAQVIDQCLLSVHHVPDRHHRERGAVGFSGIRVYRSRPGRPFAAPEHVRTDHEVPVSIKGFSRADHAVPPART